MPIGNLPQDGEQSDGEVCGCGQCITVDTGLELILPQTHETWRNWGGFICWLSFGGLREPSVYPFSSSQALSQLRERQAVSYFPDRN